MNIDIYEYEKKYSFELKPITQMCGQNIQKKVFILESLRKYFSTYKYRETRNRWRDNVRIDNEQVGRKYFSVVSINGIAELLNMIKLSKQGLMINYIKQLTQKFDWQLHLRTIDEELEEMFRFMNGEINKLGNIELTYEEADIWEMVQKSNVMGMNQMILEDVNNYDLLVIFLNLIKEIMKIEPQKMLVIIENIDHLISTKEYIDVLKKINNISVKYDIYFILSTSLEGYVVCEKELCDGIIIWGDEDFQMPKMSELLTYIQNNYPYNKKFSEEQLQKDLTSIMHKICSEKYLMNVEENVICKMINQTLMLHEKWSGTENMLEIAFLNS